MRWLEISCAILVGALAGCAGRQPVLEETLKPSDTEFDCTGLHVVYDDSVNRALSKQQIQIDRDNADVALGLGAVLFWPTLFFIDTKNAEGAEALNLINRARAMRSLADGKGCNVAAWRDLPDLEIVAATPAPGKPPEEVRLDSAEIEALLTGAHAECVRGPTVGVIVTYGENGEMSGARSGDSDSDAGRWSVADDRVCQQWAHWDDARERCYSVYDQGTGEYRLNPGGGRRSTYVRLEGQATTG